MLLGHCKQIANRVTTGQQGVFQGVMVVCDIARDGGMVGGWVGEIDGAGGRGGSAGGGAQ